MGSMMVWWLALLAHSKKDGGSYPCGSLPVCNLYVLSVLAWVFVGFSGFLQLPPTAQKHES